MSSKPIIAILLTAIFAGVASALTVLTLAAGDGDGDTDTAKTLAAIENRITYLEEVQALSPASGPQSSQSDQTADNATTVSVVRAAEPAQRRNNRNPFESTQFQELMDETQDPEVRLARARELLDSPFPPARLMATQALIEFNDEQALDAVREMVAEMGNDRRSQRTAVAAIDMLRDAQGSAVDADLYEYLNHDNDAVQLAAARSLEARGDAYPMSILVDTIARNLDSSDDGQRSRAAQELGQTQSPTAVAPLTSVLNDKNSEVRLRAVQALGRTGDVAAITQLTAALDDPIAEVRSAASRSINQIRNPSDARGISTVSFRFPR